MMTLPCPAAPPFDAAAWEAALRRAVTPGGAVLLLGDAWGVLAVLACRLGARRVYAVGSAGEVALAKRVVADNGCADRVTFLRGARHALELPERVDVAVGDPRGSLPLGDDRRRHLAPGGRTIPELERLWVAPVESTHLHETLGPSSLAGVDLRARLQFRANEMGEVCCPESLAFPWEPRVAWEEGGQDHESTWAADAPCIVHGLAAWREAVLGDGLATSGDPRRASPGWRAAWLPAATPLTVARGDNLTVHLRARESIHGPVWSWGAALRSGAEEKGAFSQCSLFAAPDLTEAMFPAPGEDYA